MAYALRPLPPDDHREHFFPPRRPRRGLVLIAAVAVMFGAAGGLWMLNRALTRPPAAGEVPLIRADDQPTRKRPSDPGGMQAPGQGTLVLDGQRAGSKVEQLLPPPEAPLPRPTPPEPVAAAPEPPPPSPSAAPIPTPPALAASPAPPPSVAAGLPVPPPPEPKPATAAPAVAPPPASPAARGYRVQLGAVRTAESAKRDWDRLKQQHRDVLGSLSLNVERVDLGDRGIFFRIQAGPVADAAAAERDCKELKRRGVGCVPVRP